MLDHCCPIDYGGREGPCIRNALQRIAMLRTPVVGSVSETRCKYVPVSSGPASLRATVSETDPTTRILGRGNQVCGLAVIVDKNVE